MNRIMEVASFFFNFACFLLGIQATGIILIVPHKDDTEAHPGSLSLSLTLKDTHMHAPLGLLVCDFFFSNIGTILHNLSLYV